jgi:hypothetical protein
LWKRIWHSGHDPANTSAQHGIGTWWRLTVVAARLEGDVKRGRTGSFTRGGQRMDLGVCFSVALVPAGADFLSVANDHGTDKGIRFHIAPAALGQFQSAAHPLLICTGHALHLNRSQARKMAPGRQG